MMTPRRQNALRAPCLVAAAALGCCNSAIAQTSQPVALHLQFDLSLGLQKGLVATSYEDEGISVPAEAGKSVALLPFPIAPLAGLGRELVIGPTTIKLDSASRKRARLIGFRTLGVKDGHSIDMGAAAAPVFERLIVKPVHHAKASIEAVNSQHPAARAKPPAEHTRPSPEQTKPPPEHTKPPAGDQGHKPPGKKGPPPKANPPQHGGPTLLDPDDWLAMIVETETGVEHLDISLLKEPPERIDVRYLAKAAEPLAWTDRTTMDHPVVQETFRIANGGSPVMAALGLGRLALWRTTAPARTPPTVMSAITEHLAGGLSASDLRPREAAWHALSHGPLPGPIERAAIAAAGTTAQGVIASLAARDLPHAVADRRRNILALLNDVWRAGDGSMGARVVDAVVADAEPDAFGVLDGASPAGREELFKRIRTDARATVKAGLARALIGQTPVEREPALLAEARRLTLEIIDPADPIFKRFEAANDPRARVSIIGALAVVSTGPVRHTLEFARFVESATGNRQAAAVREAAFNMVVAQAAAATPARELQPYGAFPVSTPATGLDGLTAGLVHAMQDGAPATQVAALRALVLRGEARCAADALRSKRLTSDGLAALLSRLVAQDGVPHADGLFAFLIEIAAESDRSAVAVALRQLDQSAGLYPEGASWRMGAAIRGGIDWTRMVAMSADREPATAAAAKRWLRAAAHLDARQAAALAAGKPGERTKLLARINAERSARLEGRYGCLMLVEIIEPLDPIRFGAAPVARWAAPVRVNLFGPIVEIQSGPDRYAVVAGGRQLGQGRPIRTEPKLPDRKLWPPALAPAAWTVRGVGYDQKGGPVGFNPLALPGSPLLPDGSEGALNIDAAALLRAGLTNAATEPAMGLTASVPTSLQLTLRPVGFGALAGAAPSQPPSASKTPSAPVLLNMLVLLEPLD